MNPVSTSVFVLCAAALLSVTTSVAPVAKNVPFGGASSSGIAADEALREEPGVAEKAATPKGGGSSQAKGSEANRGLTLADIPKDQVITVEDLVELREKDRTYKGFVIIDVRSLTKYDAGHVPGSLCVPAGRIFEIRMREVPRDKDVVLIDADGSRVAETWQTLVDNGYDPERIKVVSDGMDAWFAADLPIEISTARMWC